ncbi:dienelactone hydrolase family protein [Edaphobacter flagellatus]|uniref:dienelactone hydrolase family protein n=1 Tax=Edaphobacter flagellatus TaxID=1933044 RepID=UPI0021B4B100|nr:dienelactone hydrolase family protein [Edaphobacter flagellatus]
MVEQDIQLTTADGVTDAVLFTPDASKALPGILHIPDIGSIREIQRAMARRLAAEGYTVLLPNPFYRTSRPPVFPPEAKHGTPERTKRLQELSSPLTPERMTQDLAVYLDYLTGQPTTDKGKIGVVGYCIGGGMALRAAAVMPDRVGAVASFHGGGLYKADNPASPHLVLSQVKAQLYFGHASEDGSMTADDIAHFEEKLKEWGGIYESETYPARHGWTVSDNPAYNHAEAERAYVKMTALFKAALR